MTRGYAIWRATLGPRGSERFGTQQKYAIGPYVPAEEVSVCIALDDAVASKDDLVLGEVARELDIVTAETEGAINLSPLKWGYSDPREALPREQFLIDGIPSNANPAWIGPWNTTESEVRA